jgi:hypothetical protein
VRTIRKNRGKLSLTKYPFLSLLFHPQLNVYTYSLLSCFHAGCSMSWVTVAVRSDILYRIFCGNPTCGEGSSSLQTQLSQESKKLRLGERVGHEILFFCVIHVFIIMSELLLLANLETVWVLGFAAHTCKIRDINESGVGAQKCS